MVVHSTSAVLISLMDLGEMPFVQKKRRPGGCSVLFAALTFANFVCFYLSMPRLSVGLTGSVSFSPQ